MKLSVLIVIALAGFLIYQIATQPPSPAVPADPAVPPVQPYTPFPVATPIPVATPVARKVWKLEELVVIHGVITERRVDGVTVRCLEPDYHGVDITPLLAGGGTADSRYLAKEAMRPDLEKFGPIMTRESGQWREAEYRPVALKSGTVQVLGYPPPGEFTNAGMVNMVAAPLGGNGYTTEFQVPPGSWMKYRKGTLDK